MPTLQLWGLGDLYLSPVVGRGSRKYNEDFEEKERTDGSDSADTQLTQQTRRRQTRVRDMYTRTARRKMGEGAGWRNDDPLIIFIFSETSGLFSQSSSFNVVKKVKRQSLPSLRSQP